MVDFSKRIKRKTENLEPVPDVDEIDGLMTEAIQDQDDGPPSLEFDAELDLPEKEMNLDLSPEFLNAFELANKDGVNLFITGDAGSGKSTWLRYFIKNTDKRVAVVAPTGIAAINVGGSTIHSFFRLGIHPIYPSQLRALSRERFEEKIKIMERLDVLVIDEISMVRADLLDLVDMSLRLNRHNDDPFGGVQVIAVGDLNQLPPVVASDAERTIMKDYDSPYFFDAKVCNQAPFKLVQFTKVYRQTDQHFIEILNRMKRDKTTGDDLYELNERLNPNAEYEDGRIVLTAVNKTARQINDRRLSEIKSDAHTFDADMQGKFNIKGTNIEEKLVLKVGAQVMTTINDPGGSFHNGSIGHVTGFDKGVIFVKIGDKITEISRHVWEGMEYAVEGKNVKSKQVGSCSQYPLKLAWAYSVHKSQGQTFDKVHIDVGRGMFSHGQLYVALSRCTTLEGITLSKPVRINDIIFDERVLNYMDVS